VVWTRVPQEEGKTGSQFEIGEIRISPNRAIEKFGARQHRRHDLLDSEIETSTPFSGLIERHEAIHIFRGYWPAERPARQVFGNLSRARGLARFLGFADEDQCAAGSPRNTGRVIWPEDFDAVGKTRHTAVAGAEPKSANAAESVGDVLVGLHMRTVD